MDCAPVIMLAHPTRHPRWIAPQRVRHRVSVRDAMRTARPIPARREGGLFGGRFEFRVFSGESTGDSTVYAPSGRRTEWWGSGSSLESLRGRFCAPATFFASTSVRSLKYERDCADQS